MNKIDEQPDKGSRSPGEDVKTSSRVAPSVPRSRPIAAEAATVASMDLRFEQDSLQVVTSKTTSRRAWLRRGVAVASPVVASLVSAPVYAAGVCAIPSGMISDNTFKSRHPSAVVCTIQGLNYWLGSFPSGWPSSPSPNTKVAQFTDVFGLPAVGPEALVGVRKLNEVLGGSFSPLAQYSIAAYLNARTGAAGFPSAFTPAQAIAVYRSYRGGSFSTLLVTGWSEDQTVTWLKTLMP